MLEVSTDKVDTEIPSPAAGTLQRIVVGEDETVEVGAELAVIGDGGSGGSSGSDSPADEGEQAEEAPLADEPEAEDASRPAQPSEPEQDQGGDTGNGRSSGPGGSGGSGTTVTMPALGESVTEGTVTRWLKQQGDQVDVDEPLLEVSTDKVDTEIPSPAAGTLLEISVGEDETVEVGAQLAVIGESSGGSPDSGRQQAPAEQATERAEPAEDSGQRSGPAHAAPEAPEPDRSRPAAEPEQAQSSEPPAPAEGSSDNGVPYVTPLVRKLATEHGVDLNSLQGSGVGGRIRKQDVLAAADKAEEPEPSAPAPSGAAASAPARPSAPSPTEPSPADAAKLRGSTQKMSRLRGVIAERMVESLQVSAQLTAMLEVDLTRVAQLRQRAKADFEAREGVKLSFLPFFVKVTVDTLKLFPQVNASIDTAAKTVTYHDAEHVGIAVDTEKGLIVPVLHNAGDLSLAGLAKGIADLAERTRTNKIKPDELAGGTFTVTNIGSRGALTDTPIINQPQVGILGTGAVVKRPVVVPDELGQDSIAIRSIAALVLTYDHRLVDGADAARFLSAVKRRMETASFEADLGL